MFKQSGSEKLVSLRSRFKLLASILVFFIIAGAWFGYQNQSNTRLAIENNLIERNNLLESTHIIRALLLDAYKSIDSFLLEPSQIEYRDNIFISIKEALFYTNQLLEAAPTNEEIRAEDIRQLIATLKKLDSDATELIETRLDSSRQYPSMAVGGEVMQPNRNRANNAIALAINALKGDEKPEGRPDVLEQFITVRHLWTQVLSNFRLYLANRVGSFNEAALPIQERGIETMYKEYRVEMARIQQLVDDEIVGFETGDAYVDMLEATENWFDGFQKVKFIHHTSEWRIDAKLMKENIVPSIQQASSLLRTVNDRIVQAAEQDIETIENVASQQTLVLWLIAGVGIAFILSVVMSAERLVFAPIAVIARALKAQALGKPNLEIPVSRSTETRDLTQAFGEMSRQIHMRQSELEYRALHDSLTSLPNRTLLYENINHDISIARRDGTQLALLIIDLDRFKEVNDTLGHQVGDQLLVDVGKRLNSSLREVDTVARMGGDEFAVLLPDVNPSQAELVANKLHESSQTPYEMNELKLAASASIGIAMYPEHGEDAQSLLRHADVAMYQAKQDRTGYSIYDPENDQYSIQRFAMITELREALQQDKLELFYQPKLDVKSKDVLGVEALLRWNHPEHGFVPPEQIVDLAEHTGTISTLTYWVIETALKQIIAWQSSGINLEISVNISAHNLRDESFVDKVRQVLHRYEFPCQLLTLEITENAMMENPIRAIDILNELDEMGIRLTVDDYGTGFSSLYYLSKLPVDELKIDKSFVFDMDTDRNNETIVRSTIELAHNLGLNVVAEGIESELVWNILRSFGCDHAQGFYMSKPLPANELELWLEQNH